MKLMAVNCKDLSGFTVFPTHYWYFTVRDEIAKYVVGHLRCWGYFSFCFSKWVEYSCKKLEKENCNVRIDSNTFYFKDLMKGLRPIALAVSLPAPSYLSSLLLLIALLFCLWRRNCPFYVPVATEEKALWSASDTCPHLPLWKNLTHACHSA